MREEAASLRAHVATWRALAAGAAAWAEANLLAQARHASVVQKAKRLHWSWRAVAVDQVAAVADHSGSLECLIVAALASSYRDLWKEVRSPGLLLTGVWEVSGAAAAAWRQWQVRLWGSWWQRVRQPHPRHQSNQSAQVACQVERTGAVAGKPCLPSSAPAQLS